MKIDHIAMYVLDLENAKDFFVNYFNATQNQGYHNKNTEYDPIFCLLKMAQDWRL